MNQKNGPALVILAAGMGSRYGGLKQMDAFGPNGETIIDYSIYDAIRAGFTKVVFVIREHFKEDFKEFFKGKFDDQVDVHYVTQELEMLPDGYDLPEHRQKPWGTAHAVGVAESVIDEPFAVINADDYYGIPAYKTLYDFLMSEHDQEPYSVVGYFLKNTLSDHGTVNRGVCFGDEDGNLVKVKECTKISKAEDGTISFPINEGEKEYLEPDTVVSMNMWGFYPSYFKFFDIAFRDFLDRRMNEEKSEYYIPTMVDQLIKDGTRDVRILTSDADWFGVTYREDKPIVMSKLQALIDSGKYPQKLWHGDDEE